MFYRAGPYAPLDPKKLFADEAARAELRARVGSIATAANIMRDCRAFLDHLAAQPNVRQPKVGTTGYCMGGRLSLCAAGHFPDRIAAKPNFPDEQKQRLEQALTAAHVDHVIETYPARHGWVPQDTPVHDAAAAERHWKTLLDLFGRTLGS